MSLSTLRYFAKFLTLVIYLALPINLLSSYRKSVLPSSSEILPALLSDPEQKEISARQFQLNHRGTEYTIEPVATYKISGLVVTHNDITALSDIYHSSDSVDLKDLCLIWGENTASDAFHRVKFWSEPWSCQYQLENGTPFYSDQLSNTHLLTDSERVARTIREIAIGDQVQLSGKLINYAPSCCSEQTRNSSLVRDDEGNGACEVMLVEEAKILKKGNPSWHTAYKISRYVLIWTILLKVILFLWITYAEAYR